MRKAFISLYLEAEKMKRLLIALVICFVFSSVAQAGKSGFGPMRKGAMNEVSHAPSQEGGVPYCTYEGYLEYAVYVKARKDMLLAFELVTNNESANLYTRSFSHTENLAARYLPNFEVDAGTSWTLYWTLMRTKGKGHIIDVIEVESGTCN
jgi:hypothetical protein